MRKETKRKEKCLTNLSGLGIMFLHLPTPMHSYDAQFPLDVGLGAMVGPLVVMWALIRYWCGCSYFICVVGGGGVFFTIAQEHIRKNTTKIRKFMQSCVWLHQDCFLQHFNQVPMCRTHEMGRRAIWPRPQSQGGLKLWLPFSGKWQIRAEEQEEASSQMLISTLSCSLDIFF